MLRPALLFFALLLCFAGRAQQTLKLNDRSALVHVFRLSDADMVRYLEQEPSHFDSSYCHTPVDSFPAEDAYGKELPPGYYVFVFADNLQLRQQLLHFSNYEVQLVNNGRELNIRVFDKRTGQAVRDAAVHNGTRLVKHVAGAECYRTGKLWDKQLTVAVGGELIRLSVEHELNRKRRSRQEKSAAYVAFNKPKYLPGDTVRMKIYCQRKGRLYKKSAGLEIRRNYHYGDPGGEVRILRKHVKPVRPGVFLYELPLGDTLLIDRSYEVRLIKKFKKRSWREKRLATGDFRLEDYQLDEMFGEIGSEKPEYDKKDSVILELEVRDANKLFVPDARVQLSIIPYRIAECTQQGLSIPYEVHRIERALEPSRPTRIALPPQLFPAADVQYKAIAVFANSNNETQKDSCWFSVSQKNSEIVVTQSNDTIRAVYYENGKEKNASGFMWIIMNADTAGKKAISFPHTFVNYPFAPAYFFSTGKAHAQFGYSYPAPSAVTRRTNDSVFIELENPHKLQVNYTLFRGKKKIHEGSGASYSYAAQDVSETPYRFEYRYRSGTQEHTRVRSILPRTRTLNVEITQPQQVFPGQKAAVTVKVTDFEGKPVANADITASAVSAQFEESGAPQLQDFNVRPGLKKKQYAKYRLLSPESMHHSQLTRYWYKRLRLDTVHLYALHRPGKKMYLRYLPTGEGHAPQLAVFPVRGDYVFSDISAVYIDDVPVFVSLGPVSRYRPASSAYSFAVTPGKHRVRIRLEEAEYVLPELEVKAGYKLEVSFDPAQLPEGFSKTKKKKRLDKQEREFMKRHLLFVKRNYYYSDNYFYQDSGSVMHAQGSCYLPVRPDRPVHYQVRNGSTRVSNVLQMRPTGITAFDADSFLVKTAELKLRKKLNSYNRLRPGELCLRVKDLPGVERYSYGQRMLLPQNPKRTGRDKGTLLITLSGEENAISDYILQSLDADGRPDGKVIRVHPGQVRAVYNASNRSLLMPDLLPGRYRLHIFAPNGDHQLLDTLRVRAGALSCYQADPGKFRRAEELQKDMTTPFCSISYTAERGSIGGRIKMSEGGSIPAELSIAAGAGNYRRKEVYPDANGNFLVTGLEPGLWNLYVSSPGLHKMSILCILLSETRSPQLTITLDEKFVDSTGRHHLLFEGRHLLVAGSPEPQQPRPDVQTGNPSRWHHFSNRLIYVPGERRFNHRFVHTYSGFMHDGNYMYFTDPGWQRPSRRGRLFGRLFKRSYAYHSTYKRKFRTVSTPSFDNNMDMSGGFEREGKELAEVVVDRRIYPWGNTRGERMEDGIANEITLLPGAVATGGVPAMFVEFDKDFSGRSLDIPALSDVPPGLGGIRSVFSDYAYWQPLLITDENGKVTFEAVFPGNLTGWKSYAAAMGERSSGLARDFTASFKPLSAALNLPRFLVEGDTTFVVGKTFNYTKDSLAVSTSFRQDDQALSSKNHVVKNAVIETQQIAAGAARDSLVLEYSLTAKDNYRDGEERSIAVLPQGVEEAVGEFWLLEGDTTFTAAINAGAEKIEVSAFGNELEVLLDKIKTIKAYEYECNEQLASKLKALIMEKKICALLKKPFRGENQVVRIIKRLEKTQQPQGYWGWWEGSPPNVFMTVTVADALLMAKQAGYGVSKLWTTMSYLSEQNRAFSPDDRAQAFLLLQKGGYKSAVKDEDIIALEKHEDLSLRSRYLLLHLRQLRGMTYAGEMEKMLKEKKGTMLGGSYWGEHSTAWYDNSAQLTLMAYRVLETDSNKKEELKAIRNYFLEPNNTNVHRNTYESASILETILPAYLKDYKGETKPVQLTLSGALNDAPKQLPLTKKYKPSSGSVTIKKTGPSPLYLSVFERKWNKKPDPRSDLFDVRTSFFSDGKIVDTLKAGEPVLLKVEVDAKKKGNYVMIEVPIPAGCSYGGKQKDRASAESHREAFRHKTAIFCESLPQGKHTFWIELEPRYTGSYTLNPAKASLMYFPTFYGRTGMNKTVIEK